MEDIKITRGETMSIEPRTPDSKAIKAIRTHLHSILGFVLNLPKSRETSLAYTSLQRAKMWGGQYLKALGEPSPYPQSDNPRSDVIEPQADTAPALQWNDGDHIGSVKYARSLIGDVAGALQGSHNITCRELDQIEISLIDARMWLGQELDRIRNIQVDAARPEQPKG